MSARAVARIVVGVTLRVELYDESDSSEARIGIEQATLENAKKKAAAVISASAQSPSTKVVLNPGAPKLREEVPGASPRPFFVLPNVVPQSGKLTFNNFRKADELEIDLHLASLPVPLQAIRAISCEAIVDQVSADAWAEAVATGRSPAPALREDFANVDFAGVCTEIKDKVGHSVPAITLRFSDYLGILEKKKVDAGKDLNRELPLSQALADFLVGTPAEGLDVVWTDPDYPEPSFSLPKAKKKTAKAPAVPKSSKKNYLETIVEECALIGVVPRVVVHRLELAFGGTVYEGRDRNGGDVRARLAIGRVIESWEGSHALLNTKQQAVMVHSYNPDTDETFQARWPPDPKGEKGARKVEPGQPIRMPPMVANVGLPGFEQLDESIVPISLGPVADPSTLPQVAQAIFLERNRQKVKYTARTHSPWSDPLRADETGPDLLRLRAGDTVALEVDNQALLPLEVLGSRGVLPEEPMAALLVAGGAAREAATRAAAAIARAPTTSRWRVEDLGIAWGSSAAELTFQLVNFTVITADLQAAATGQTPRDTADTIQAQAYRLPGLSLEAIDAMFAKARIAIDESQASDADRAEAKKRLDELQKRAKAGR